MSYTKNYLKIYLWQGLSFVLSFLSMFVVVPMISADKPIYGIYTICVSLSIFLQYADLGFLGAGQKFAAEAFAKKDLTTEIRITGFTTFILLIFLLLLSVVFLVFAYAPQLIIDNLTDPAKYNIAQQLLLVLALTTPITLLQRIVQMIYVIRMEDYIFQRINIIGNTIKILSVFYFFGGERYNIVGYFLFIQLVSLIVPMVNIALAHRRYNYDIGLLLKSIRFDRTIFAQTQRLAFSLFFGMIAWILYYELDAVSIGALWGAEKVAIYGIGFTLLTFVRTILGTLFSPFYARFNHFVDNEEGLKKLLSDVTVLYQPIVMYMLLSVTFLAEPLVLCWVGDSYRASVPVVRWLMLCSRYAFIRYPVGALLVVKQRVKEMYYLNWLVPLVFWGGILATQHYLQELSFAFFKWLAFLIMMLVYYKILLSYLQLSLVNSLKRYIFALFLPLAFLVGYYFLVQQLFVAEQNTPKLLTTALLIAIAFGAWMLLHYVSSRAFRQVVRTITTRLLKKN